MSVAEALVAALTGDPAESERQINKALLKSAVCTAIFCPSCGAVLDVARAVLVTSKRPTGGCAVTCGTCYDRAQAALGAELGPDQLARALASVDVADGRKLSKRAKGKAPVADFAGTARNRATGETREVTLTVGEVRALLDDEEPATCAGECECQVEPDGKCPEGWPSKLRAVGMV